MTAVETHPAARATHLLLDAIAEILRGHPNSAVNLVERATEDVAATYEAYDEVLAANARLLAQNVQLTTHVRGMRDEGLAAERRITDLSTRLAIASRDLEQVLQRVSMRLQAETIDFNLIRGLRDVLDSSNGVADHGEYVILDTRREAAGAPA